MNERSMEISKESGNTLKKLWINIFQVQLICTLIHVICDGRVIDVLSPWLTNTDEIIGNIGRRWVERIVDCIILLWKIDRSKFNFRLVKLFWVNLSVFYWCWYCEQVPDGFLFISERDKKAGSSVQYKGGGKVPANI